MFYEIKIWQHRTTKNQQNIVVFHVEEDGDDVPLPELQIGRYINFWTSYGVALTIDFGDTCVVVPPYSVREVSIDKVQERPERIISSLVFFSPDDGRECVYPST